MEPRHSDGLTASHVVEVHLLALEGHVSLQAAINCVTTLKSYLVASGPVMPSHSTQRQRHSETGDALSISEL